MSKVITNGTPGAVWTNATGKVQYQLLVSWANSCGLCCQFDRAIGPLWPTPFHRGCRCKQKAIWPGKTSDPFVDFREKILALDHAQQTRVIGRSNLVLVEAGIVRWSDVVTSARVRSLREVVSRQKLTVSQMTSAGVVKRIAEGAYQSVHTPAHAIAEADKKEAVKKLLGLGLTKGEVEGMAGAKLAGRVVIAGGPSGPGPMPKPPTPAAPPKPTPPPVVLPAAAPPAQRLSAAEIQQLFGIKLKAPKKPEPFPVSPDGLVVVKPLGGSTGAELVKDPATGKLFVRKTGNNPGHLREEAHADAAYRALGIDVPASKIYETASGPVKLAEFHQGTTLKDLMKSDPVAAEKAMAKLRKSFVCDALLGNWDVIGMDFDNILVTPQGKVLRIDNGGALRYRAQGAKKSAAAWSGSVNELQTLRDASVNPAAAKVFGAVTDAEIRSQAKAILKKKDALLASLPAEIRGTIEQRLADLARVAAEKPVKAKVSAATVKRFGADTKAMESWGTAHYRDWAQSLKAEESRALGEYTGSGYRRMNRILRTGGQADKQIKALEEALRRAKLAEAIEVTRGVGRLADTGHSPDQFKPGFVFEDKGFMSTSLRDTPPLGQGAHLVIRLPKGAPGAYVNASPASSVPSEREFLLPPGTKLRVIERKLVNGTDTVFAEYHP